MIGATRPGGWVLVEEPDMLTVGRGHPEDPAVARFAAGLDALMRAGGGDPELGMRLPSALRGAGLVEIDCTMRISVADASAMRSHLDAAADKLVATGLMTAQEVARVADHYERPDTFLYGPIIVAAWGRRPAASRPELGG